MPINLMRICEIASVNWQRKLLPDIILVDVFGKNYKVLIRRLAGLAH